MSFKGDFYEIHPFFGPSHREACQRVFYVGGPGTHINSNNKYH